MAIDRDPFGRTPDRGRGVGEPNASGRGPSEPTPRWVGESRCVSGIGRLELQPDS
jgi:hypothetical protein